MQRITIGFSIHRPEIVRLTANFMQGHEAVFLEEPPQSGFQQMLAGALAIEDYLLPIDIEYPDFSRRMCRLLGELNADGTKIIQVEPFIEHLLAIHELFSRGHSPADLNPQTIQYQVYVAERDATKALLDYYQTVMNGSFVAVIQAIIRFARADAARFRLRDYLRARDLADKIARYRTAFIEAGLIHYGLYRQLKHRLPQQVQVRPLFIAHEALHALGEHGHLFGPGDQLTLTYIFHPNIKDTQREVLLAARSLVYSKLVEKNELAANLETFPHVRNELACIWTVKLLTLGDCERLYPLIRRAKSVHTRQLVDDYLVRFKKNLRPEINRLTN